MMDSVERGIVYSGKLLFESSKKYFRHEGVESIEINVILQE